VPEREWMLGIDLSTYDNLLDPITFDDLILAAHHNCHELTPDQVQKTLCEMLESRLQDTMFLLSKNMDAIISKAAEGRGE